MAIELDNLRCALGAIAATVMLAAGPASAQSVSFKEDILPVLELRCVACHQPGGTGFLANGLDLRTYESIMAGTSHGPVVVPRSVITSNLIAVVERRTDPEIWMPHKQQQLSTCERRSLRFWVSQGARNN